MRSLHFLAIFICFTKLALADFDCPTFQNPQPAPSTLPAHSTLTDPFTYFQSTRRVASPAEWYACRQPEIKRIVQEYQFDFYPLRSAEVVRPTRIGNVLRIVIDAVGRTAVFNSTLALPSGASADNPVPVIISIGPTDTDFYLKAGIAVATVDYQAIAADSDAKTGAFWDLYYGRIIGVLLAWGWGVHRTLDAIEMVVPEIDPTRVGTIGCGRLGKAALAAGLFDHRILVTVPMSSGIQGLGPYRYYNLSGNGQSLEDVRRDEGWLTSWGYMRGFLNNHERLPFDAHLVAAALAPRYLISDEGESDPVANARGAASVVYPAAREVYKWLGVEDRIGISVRPGGHCDTSGHENVLPFIQNVFFNKPTSKNYNDISPWSPVSSAFPWATSIPAWTGPIPTPTTTFTTTTSTTMTTFPTGPTTTIPPPWICVSRGGQCGGIGYSGITCCATGSQCVWLNEWYSQCQ